MHLFDPSETLEERIERLTRERDEARAWARGYASGMFLFEGTPYSVDDPPHWLIDRFDENGEPCDAYGYPIPPELADPRLF